MSYWEESDMKSLVVHCVFHVTAVSFMHVLILINFVGYECNQDGKYLNNVFKSLVCKTVE